MTRAGISCETIKTRGQLRLLGLCREGMTVLRSILRLREVLAKADCVNPERREVLLLLETLESRHSWIMVQMAKTFRTMTVFTSVLNCEGAASDVCNVCPYKGKPQEPESKGVGGGR